MDKKFDILLFGASGYTGQFVILQLNKFAKKFKWGIAGRDISKLRNALSEVAKRADSDADLVNVPIVFANVENEETIKNMTANAKIIINCCGPFDLYGEVVVKCCIETGTHYVDITAEFQFASRMLNNYGKSAEKHGVYIVHCCGFDSIPTDLGICFMENNFQGVINSVEAYLQVFDKNVNYVSTVNYGTWASVLNFVSGTLFKILFSKSTPNEVEYKPKLKVKFLTKYDGFWACPLPTCDKEIVHESQQYFYQQNAKRPIQMNIYALIPSFKYLIVGSFMVSIIGILLLSKFGKSLLLKYPEFFTRGLITHNPPIDNTDKMNFTEFFKCYGWSNKLENVNDDYTTPPNKEVIGCVSGNNPGYGFTSLTATLSALTILTEIENLPPKGGVYTPAMAFSKTSLTKQLQNNGVTFKIISTRDV